ncbi:hypothetical protein I4U23_017350 [Adineta vaga]|nr:hypothetical protein I4U23_017350 [Adineta vaga]
MKTLNDKKQFKQAIDLFYTYEQKNDEKNISDAAINQVLKSFTNIKDFRGASLIHFYMQSGDITRAQEIFDKTKMKTTGIYGAMMKGFIKNQMLNKAIDIFNEISNPDEANFVLLFNACAQLRTQEALIIVKKVFSNLPKCHENSLNIMINAFDAFIKCDDLSNAEQIFPKLKIYTNSCGN